MAFPTDQGAQRGPLIYDLTAPKLLQELPTLAILCYVSDGQLLEVNQAFDEEFMGLGLDGLHRVALLAQYSYHVALVRLWSRPSVLYFEHQVVTLGHAVVTLLLFALTEEIGCHLWLWLDLLPEKLDWNVGGWQLCPSNKVVLTVPLYDHKLVFILLLEPAVCMLFQGLSIVDVVC